MLAQSEMAVVFVPGEVISQGSPVFYWANGREST